MSKTRESNPADLYNGHTTWVGILAALIVYSDKLVQPYELLVQIPAWIFLIANLLAILWILDEEGRQGKWSVGKSLLTTLICMVPTLGFVVLCTVPVYPIFVKCALAGIGSILILRMIRRLKIAPQKRKELEHD